MLKTRLKQRADITPYRMDLLHGSSWDWIESSGCLAVNRKEMFNNYNLRK